MLQNITVFISGWWWDQELFLYCPFHLSVHVKIFVRCTILSEMAKKKYIKKKKTNDLIRQFSAFSLTKKTQSGLHRPLFLPQSESLAMCPQGPFLTHRDKRVQTWGTKSQSCLGAQLEGNFCFDYRLLNWPCLPFLFPSFRSKSSSALLSSAQPPRDFSPYMMDRW